jgi:small-conductance mechanosensitive channel
MFSQTLFHLGPYEVCFWNIIILALIVFVSILLRRVVHRNLKRVLVSNNIQIEGRRATRLRLLSQSIYLLAAYAAIYSFSVNNENVSFEDFLTYNLFTTKWLSLSFAHILGILLIFTLARMLVNFITLYITRTVKGRTHLDAGTSFIYVTIAKYIIYVVSIFLCLRVLQVDLTLLLGGSAALLVGLGLGLQDVFRDIFSGFVLLFEGNVKVGDVVELYSTPDGVPVVARIIKINVRTTQIETREGNILIVPNNKLTQDLVENWSHGSALSAFIIDVSVEYGTDTELVKNLLKKATLSHPKVDKKEGANVRLKNFGDNGLDLEIIFWAEQTWEVNNVKSDIRFEIDRLFREYKIVIPYPKRDIVK